MPSGTPRMKPAGKDRFKKGFLSSPVFLLVHEINLIQLFQEMDESRQHCVSIVLSAVLTGPGELAFLIQNKEYQIGRMICLQSQAFICNSFSFPVYFI